MSIPRLLEEISGPKVNRKKLEGFLTFVTANRNPFSAHVRKSRRTYKSLINRVRTGKQGPEAVRCLHQTYLRAKELGFQGTQPDWAKILIPLP